MTNSTADPVDNRPWYQRMEDDCEVKHIYPLYRVLEDEYVHQHGELPEKYMAAKKKIDLEVQAKLKPKIEAEADRQLKAEAERLAAHGERAEQATSEDERHLRATAERKKLIDAGWAEKYLRQVALVNDRFTAELYKHIHELEEKRTALCFSGGGIRSASFGLGIVQGLARYGMLDKFDYLSTVSGGGYLGGWLSAWIHRVRMQHVITALKNEPAKNKIQPEPAPIRHLRSYSNYLNPKLGFLSADTWTLVATVVRNMLLNWLLLIPIILAALMLPRIVVAVVQMNPHLLLNWLLLLPTIHTTQMPPSIVFNAVQMNSWPVALYAVAFSVGTLAGLWAMVYMGVARPSANQPRQPDHSGFSQQARFRANAS